MTKYKESSFSQRIFLDLIRPLSDYSSDELISLAEDFEKGDGIYKDVSKVLIRIAGLHALVELIFDEDFDKKITEDEEDG